MTPRQMENRVRKIKALEADAKRIKTEIDALKTELKDALGDAEEVRESRFWIRYQAISKSTFDGTRFKKDHPRMYSDYLKSSTERRFTCNTI